MATKTTTTGQKAIPSKGRRTFTGAPKGTEPRPAFVDYKDVANLKKFTTAQGKLMSRKRTGLSAAYQKALSQAIKRARFLALLPYTAE